jgi:hypothetical protein
VVAPPPVKVGLKFGNCRSAVPILVHRAKERQQAIDWFPPKIPRFCGAPATRLAVAFMLRPLVAPWSISWWQNIHKRSHQVVVGLDRPRPLPPPQFVWAAWTCDPDPHSWQSISDTNFSNFLLRTYWRLGYATGLSSISLPLLGGGIFCPKWP